MPSSNLGELVFERRPYGSTFAVSRLFGIAFLSAGLLFLWAGANAANKGDVSFGGAIGVGAGSLAVGIALIVFSLKSRGIFRCHEFGVGRSTLWGEQRLPYEDISAFTSDAVRHYVNFGYSHTALKLKFKPKPELRQRAINAKFVYKREDDAFDNVNERVSRNIATRLQAELARNGEAKWTDGLVFRNGALWYRGDLSLLFTRTPATIPLGRLTGFALRKGEFYLFAEGARRAIAHEYTSAPNFFPGLFLLRTLATQIQQTR
jgi:hypothetical protein